MGWRDAAIIQQQRVIQGVIEYRLVVLVQDNDDSGG